LYSLSRLILILTLAVYGYCGIVLATMFSPMSWYVVVPLAFLAFTKRKTLINLTAHGTAFWAGEQDLESAHMVNGKRGRLPLGRLIGPGGRAGLLEAAGALLDWKLKAKKACQEFFAALRGKKTPPLVRMPPQTINTVCFAPVGTGKSTGLCIPFLLECEDSCIVIDFKGELALATALHRKRMGHDIAIFDPYGVITK
jgi:type IV secretion system protein VirD4